MSVPLVTTSSKSIRAALTKKNTNNTKKITASKFISSLALSARLRNNRITEYLLSNNKVKHSDYLIDQKREDPNMHSFLTLDTECTVTKMDWYQECVLLKNTFLS